MAGLAERVMNEVDIGEIIRESSSTMATETVDTLRVHGMRADRLLSRTVDRVLGRREERQTDPSILRTNSPPLDEARSTHIGHDRTGREPEASGHIRRTAAEHGEEESTMAFGGGSYEIRIKGRLSDSLLAAFEGMRASVQPVETVLYGPVQDQAALYGLLNRIQSLGLELVEIRQLSAAADEVVAEPERHPPDP